jgi:hypothetical protein
MLVGFVLWFASGLTGFIIDLTGGVVQNDCPIEGFRYDTSQITPHAQASNGYIDLIINGANLEQLLPNIAVLPGFTAVFLSVAIFRLKCD